MIATRDPAISVIVPVLNEASNLPLLFQRLFPVLEGLGLLFEVIAVDDGSTDESSAVLEAEARRRPSLRVVSLARNFGQHAAVLAGFDKARGEWLITIDADLQNPPEEIPKVVDAFRCGHDLVHTARQNRQDTLFRRLASRLNSWLARRLSGVKLEDFGCMLRGYHRSVVEPMLRQHESRAYIPAVGMLYARQPVEIPVAHSARASGSSKYSLGKLIRLHLDLMTTFSLAPLRLLFAIGGIIALLAILFGALLLVLRVIHGPSWAGEGIFTLLGVLFFFVGAQFIAFGLLGEYIGRIYLEARHRPAYLLREPPRPLEGGGAALLANRLPREREEERVTAEQP